MSKSEKMLDASATGLILTLSDVSDATRRRDWRVVLVVVVVVVVAVVAQSVEDRFAKGRGGDLRCLRQCAGVR